LLMLASGVAWGVYSLRGRGVRDPTSATAGNFLRASVLSVLLGVGLMTQQNLDGPGLWYAVLSGALASGVGYAVWYTALRGLTMTSAASGVAWGVYSLRGRGVRDPTSATAGNFLRASVLSVLLGVGLLAQQNLDGPGLWYAVLSGALASGVGYAVWYTALRGLTMTSAASVQLSVPVLAALAGVAFLNEPITLRLALTSVAILGGIALVVLGKKRATAEGR